MPKVNWNATGEKTFESGLDRGTLYLPDGSAVPWNGLLSVSEKFDRSTEPVFFDGAKVTDVVTLGSFSAQLSALTYPDRLDTIEGSVELRSGVFLGEQPGGKFGLCYRTRMGDDIEGAEAGYKIHVVYNITAIPSDKVYETIGDSTSAAEFEWELVATPEHLEGFRPSSHLIIKTAELDPMLLQEIETILYGNHAVDATLMPMPDLVAYINDWFRIKITDNEDGTWTAFSPYTDYIYLLGDDQFRIESANAIFLDEDTYRITDTRDIRDVAETKIVDNGDGTWTASSSNPDAIFVSEDGEEFEIRNATIVELDEDSYQLSDTV